MNRPQILLVDDEPNLVRSLTTILEKEGLAVHAAPAVPPALEILGREPIDLIVSDLRMPGMDGIEFHDQVRERAPTIPFVLLTGQATVESAVRALKRGAADYLLKPCDPEELIIVIRRCLAHRSLARHARTLEQEVARWAVSGPIVGASPAIREIRRIIETVGATDSTVVIEGESGTGKELVARALHRASGREGPFLAVNCGAIPMSLLESQLFGHVRGAFTGANADHEGFFRGADRGTLLLDEISEMALEVQPKLLRVVESREITPVGAVRAIPVRTRVLASTNRDLRAEVEAGRFREDLYYRLNVVHLHLPPLRERLEDLPDLVREIIRSVADRFGIVGSDLAPEAMALLRGHRWPGNVRELRNVLERAIALRTGPLITSKDLGPLGPPGPAEVERPAAWKTWDQREEEHVRKALALAGGNKVRAAILLQIDRKRLYRKMKRYGIA